jgi:phosphatidylinositol glycan class B
MFVGLACFCRPTAIVFVLPLYAMRPKSLLAAVPIGAVSLVALLGIDTWFYGEFTLTLLNFFEFNVYTGMSGFYGEFPWHWYVSNALPVLLTTYLPWFAYGIYRYTKTHR